MSVKANTHQIENFALEPSCTRPHRNERINHRVGTADSCSQTDFRFIGNRHQVVVQLKTRLNWKTIHRSCVGQEIKLKVHATMFGSDTQQFPRHDNRRFSVKLKHFRNRIRIPCAKLFGYNTSVLTAAL